MRKRAGSIHLVSSCSESVWGWQKQTCPPAESPRNREPRCIFSDSEFACSPGFGDGITRLCVSTVGFLPGVLSDHCNSEGKIHLSLLLILLLTHKDQGICSVFSLYLYFLESASALHPLPSQPLLKTDSVTELAVLSTPVEPALDAHVPDFVQLFAMGIVHHF